jgi:N-acetyltransferase
MKLDTRWHTPVTLIGDAVRLEPLSEEHLTGLVEIGKDESLWEYMLYGNLSDPQNMAAWIRDLLSRQAAGTDLPFVVIHLPSGRVAGATRYMDIRPQHKGLEIGGTWYGPEYQRTQVNTECKYLLLEYAFEVLGAIRVQFKADLRNQRSWHAIERIGAKREGVFRKHYILLNGVERDSVFYSILDQEWLEVKERLKGLLGREYGVRATL